MFLLLFQITGQKKAKNSKILIKREDSLHNLSVSILKSSIEP